MRPSISMLARADRKQPGAPRPAPGAQVTIRSSRPATGGTLAAMAADRASHGPAAGVAAGETATAIVSLCITAGIDFRDTLTGDQ
jgi:hypothetical protein